NGSALGFDEVKPGESFVKIGVGAIRKPDQPQFRQFQTYDISDPGKWSVRPEPDRIEFTQELSDTAGYAYLYRKTVRLTRDKPELVLEHSLKNTGRKAIHTSVYNHDFFMLDGLPTSSDVSIRFPFEVRAKADLRGLAEIRGRELAYLQELQRGQTVFSEL